MRCIQVTYTGSLDSTVSLYGSAVGAIGQYVDLTIDKGTGMGVFPDCTGFTLAGRTSSRGTLGGFATAHTNFANGVVAAPGAQAVWSTRTTLVYRFTLTLQNNARRTACIGQPQLHVGGAERLDASDPGGPLSDPPGLPREVPVQLLPGPGSSRSKDRMQHRATHGKGEEGSGMSRSIA